VFNKARVNDLLKQAVAVVDKYYADVQAVAEMHLSSAAKVQASAVQQSMANLIVSIDASLPTEAFLSSLLGNALIQGAKSAAWWKRQAADTAFKFAAVVRQGLARGETNAQILSRVVGTQIEPGIMAVSKANARSLIHASIQKVANDARMETFQKNADVIKGVRQLSTLDSHTTEICIAYSGAEWDLEGNPTGRTTLPFNGGPPRHWGCRSVLVPITRTFAELGISGVPNLGRPAIGHARMTMRQWMDTRSAAQLDEQLGKGRAALFRSGKITLQQLLDLRGNPLSLTQLERRYGMV
jgi:hypothetical protein